jgi:hypothetical protein
MIHKTRRFNIADVNDADELTDNLVRKCWTLCTGFRYRGLLFLNDSISEDGAGEWAVYEPARYAGVDVFQQIESITFGWCSAEVAFKFITELDSGASRREVGEPHKILIHGGDQPCRLCA